MGSQEHTKATRIISSGTAPKPGAVRTEELPQATSSPQPLFRKLTNRPMLAAGVLTTVVLGSFALAGVAGALTDKSPVSVTSTDRGSRPAADPSKNSRLQRTDNAGKNGKGAQGADAAGKDKGANGQPSPSHAGLCQAYRSKVGEHPGKALQSPAFTSLIKAAGGNDNVAGYCARVLAAKQDQNKGEGKGGNNQNDHGSDRADEARNENGNQGKN
jgi:hypothetical protein